MRAPRSPSESPNLVFKMARLEERKMRFFSGDGLLSEINVMKTREAKIISNVWWDFSTDFSFGFLWITP